VSKWGRALLRVGLAEGVVGREGPGREVKVMVKRQEQETVAGFIGNRGNSESSPSERGVKRSFKLRCFPADPSSRASSSRIKTPRRKLSGCKTPEGSSASIRVTRAKQLTSGVLPAFASLLASPLPSRPLLVLSPCTSLESASLRSAPSLPPDPARRPLARVGCSPVTSLLRQHQPSPFYNRSNTRMRRDRIPSPRRHPLSPSRGCSALPCSSPTPAPAPLPVTDPRRFDIVSFSSFPDNA
jgi:hypothetical protein